MKQHQQQQSESIRLIEACKKKDLSLIRSILEERPKLINLRDKHERSLLHYIAINLEEEDEDDQQHDNDEAVKNNISCFNYLSELAESRLWKQVDLDGLSPLHLAVISCNIHLVRWMLFEHRRSERDFSRLVDLCDKELHSPLHWAVITNRLDCVKLLVKRSGVRLVHLADLNGATALHYATQTSDYPKYRQQLRLMLQNSVKSAADSTTEENNDNRLSFDTNSVFQMTLNGPGEALQILEYFVELPGVNLECLDNDKRSPLLWAASSGNRDACLLLLGRRANLMCQDANRLGALHCAASHGFTDCLECLLEAAGKQTAGHLLLDQPDNLHCTPLFYAVLSGNIDCVELLLQRGASADWQDVKGRTAAHFAALKGQLNSLKLLQQHKANLWLPNKQGDLPLHYAIKSGRQQVVAWLLSESPYEKAVNAINNLGRAPIHLAVMKNNLQMAEYLVEMGANLNQLVKVRGATGAGKSSSGVKRVSLVNQTGQHQTKSGSTYHYETALDMARRLNQSTCLQLLEQNRAQSAANVLSLRNKETAEQNNKLPTGNVRSLFDLQAAEVASPIGFETSSSSAEPQSLGEALVKSRDGQQLPRLPAAPVARTVEASVPLSDSTNSSALSQSSLTSVRLNSQEARRQQQQQRVPLAQTKRAPKADSQSADQGRPFTGGISYHNEHINASIKCKLYGRVDDDDHDDHKLDQRRNHNSRSFPPLNGQRQQKQRPSRLNGRTSNSLDRTTGSQQEIITNVNVYTSPCSHCFSLGRRHHSECQKCSSKRGRVDEHDDSSCDTSEEDERRRQVNSSSSEGTARGDEHLPPDEPSQVTASRLDRQHQQQQQQAQQVRYVPPSRNYEQHLGTILSAEEDNQRSTSGETNAQQATDDEHAMRETPETPPVVGQAKSSAGQEEPRFDRSQPVHTATLSRYHKQRGQQVKSPVAEYIHSPRPIEVYQHNNWQQQQPVGSSHKLTDYSQVKAKVDSHRNDSGLSSSHFLPGDLLDNESDFHLQQQQQQQKRSKSYNNLSHQKGHLRSPYTDDPSMQPRSVSRQTIIKTRRLSVDSVELASRIEKSIRKYKQETKLFEELQKLKRSQIRSGRANEALLVKPLVEHFKADSSQLDLLDSYLGPYTYQSYELYLYDQLRKISQSNCAKLAGNVLAPSTCTAGQHSEAQQVEETAAADDDERNYFEEDLKAELELQRVLGEANQSESIVVHPPNGTSGPFYVDEVVLEPRETMEEIRVKGKGPEERAAPLSSATSSRRSSVDIERDKVLELPLQVSSRVATEEASDEAEREEESRKSVLEDEARSLSSAIICDALGNVSRMNSPTPPEENPDIHQVEAETKEEADDRDFQEAGTEEKQPERQTGGLRRRKSVVNIGDKIETIYHNIGIEIEPVAEAEHEGAKTDDEQVVSEEEATSAGRAQVDEPQPGEIMQDQQVNENQEDAGQPSETQSTSERQTMEEQIREEEDKVAAETRKQSTGERLNQQRRRLSSPPGPLMAAKQVDLDRSRRSSYASGRDVRFEEHDEAVREQRKVFNGYDLDRLHSSRSRASADKPRDDHQQKEQGRRSPATFKRHLERSRLPKGAFRVEVPIEDIKRRWRPIKCCERSKMNLRSVAKSQPNLMVKSSSQGEEEGEEFCSNFVLIYEINKGSKTRTGGLEGERSSEGEEKKNNNRSVWCQGKMTRIVDVRALKRTLSLPECLIYSNDLLKRFNILKL